MSADISEPPSIQRERILAQHPGAIAARTKYSTAMAEINTIPLPLNGVTEIGCSAI